MEEKDSELASLTLNKKAADALTEARRLLGIKQITFASKLSTALGVEITENRLGKWARGERPVPAAVLIAAAELAGSPVEDLTLSRTDLFDIREEMRSMRRAIEELRGRNGGEP